MKLRWVYATILMIGMLALGSIANARIIGQWTFDGDFKDSVASNDGTANGDVFAGTDNGLFGGAGNTPCHF